MARRARSEGAEASSANLAPDDGTPIELGELVGNLGTSVASVLVAPRGLEVSVGEPVIHDPVGGAPIEKDSFVLAVGTRPDSGEARDLILEAGKAEASVVAFKMHGRACGWLREADEAGTAIVSVADEVSWSHLNALLALTIPSMRQAGSIPGMASVPLGDLFALANAIAGLLDGAITIEDRRGRVLAYSNLPGQRIDPPRQQSILGRQVPDTPAVRDTYKRLWASDDVIRVDEIEGMEMLPRIAAPITVGTQKLGSIWAVEGDTALGKEAEHALTEAARVAALHMIHARASRDIERSVKGDLLRSLLEGRGDPDSMANQLGVPWRTPLIVCAFQISDTDDVEELHRERLVDLVAMYSEAFRLQAATAAIGKTVYCLLPVKEHTTDTRLREIAHEIQMHAANTLGLDIHAALSSVVTDVRDVVAGSREVAKILRVLGSEKHDLPLATIDDVRSGVTLLTLKDLAREYPDLTKGAVARIAEFDAERNTTYLETLEAYLEYFGDVPAAADAISVHPNTFRYRLRRLAELFDVDLTDPDDRLVIELQLRLIKR